MIKVKALEWEEGQDLNGNDVLEAEGAGLKYRSSYNEELKLYTAEVYYCVECGCQDFDAGARGVFSMPRFFEQDSAKAACQAHHTQHVLSMIEIETPTNQGKQP